MPLRGLDRLRDGSGKTGKIGNGELRRFVPLFFQRTAKGKL
jgi:hypothetical protein